MAGGKIEILIDPDTQGFAGKLQGSMAGPLATAGKLGAQLGVLLGVGSLAAAGTQVVKIGNDFQSALNELGGVSQATEQQLAAVSARARELGSDATLIGVSAGDAAGAMTELAKGGMSVEQAMSAAHGTLQLAGAAQVDAAQAATIQSAALQAFSLDASEAGRVSDILANTANASSAEITDVAQAMQATGTVANQFGIDIDDTATAIAMFANAGIQGSDAGTMLKSALLALTDTGKPAQAAIEELGLTVYDTQGQFVGLPALFDDLAAAQTRMTPEAYQAATATLFGSDAMRLAGIAGQQGGEGFRQLNEQMNRAGSAAELAEAKTKGLPGALSNVQNQAEGAALAVYDMVQGPLTGLTNFTADNIEKFPATLSNIAQAAAPTAGVLADVAGVVVGLPTPVLAAVGALVALRTTGLGAGLQSAATRSGGAFRQFGADLAVQQRFAASSGQEIGRLNAGLAVLENRSPVIRRMGDSYRAAASPLQQWAAGHRTAAAAAGQVARSSTDAFTRIDGLNRQMGHSAAAAAGRFGGALKGTAAGGLSALKSGISGTVNALGGPWMLGLSAAVGVAGAFASEATNASAANRELSAAAAAGAAAQHDLYASLVKSNGAMNDQAKAAATGVIQSELDKVTATAKRSDGAISGLIKGINNIQGVSYEQLANAATNAAFSVDRSNASAQMAVLENQALGDAAAEAGIKVEDAAAVAQAGGPRWDALRVALRNTGAAGESMVGKLQGGRDAILATQEAASKARPGALELGEAYRLFADKMSSASDKANALKAALDGLSGTQRTAEAAEKAHNDTVRQTTQALEAGWNAADGYGEALVRNGNRIDTTSENGSKLYDTLLKLRDTTAEVAASGADMDATWAGNERNFAELAASTGLPIEKIRELAGSLGLLPEQINMAVKLEGAEPAVQEIAKVAGALIDIPPGKTVQFEMANEAAIGALRDMGWMVEQVPGTKDIKVTATTEEARAGLNEAAATANELGGIKPYLELITNAKQVSADLAQVGIQTQVLPTGHVRITDTTPENLAHLAALGIKTTTLAPGHVEISDTTPENMANLVKLAQEAARPKPGRVDITDNSLQVRQNVDQNLNGHNTKATHTISIITRGGNDLDTAGVAVGQKYGDGGIRETFADGGIRRYALGALPEQAIIAAPQGARGLVQWAEDETQGEAFIPLAPSKRDRSIPIWAETGRRLGVLDDQTGGLLAAVSGAANSALVSTLAPGGVASFADGGIMASGLISFARGVEGKPYVWGGTNWGDCSGAVSALANYVAGRDPFGSRFATASEGPELAARGFLPGSGSRGDLRIGWFNGGPAGGHTAASLPNGVNFEMGGARGNGQYGGSAAGWNLPGGTDWAHFPMSRFADLDKAGRESALDAALAALGVSAGPVLGQSPSTIGVDGSVATASSPAASSQERPKTLSGLMGEFGQNLFSDLTGDALSLLGKSDNLGPLGQAVLALEEANKAEPGGELAYEKAKLAADRAGNRVTDLEEKLRRSQASLEDKRKPREVRNSKGEVTRTDPPDPDAIRAAEEMAAKAERDLETAKRASELAAEKVRAESSAFGPSAVTAKGVPTGAGTGLLADGPIALPGLGNTSEVINYDPAAGTAQWRPLIKVALDRTGQAPADAGRTEEQMGIESNGDPKAQNNSDSNAAKGHPSMGLMQVIQPTGDAVRAKWPAHFAGLPNDLLNPLTNIVAGIDACVNSWGSLAARWPTTQGYAAGGKFMASGTADRVAPSTWRVIGDRTDVDEYYLPDNDDPRTLAYGREWAERRGLQLMRVGDSRRTPAPAPAMSGGPGRGRELTLVNHGFDRREVVAAADTITRRDRLASRRQERS